MNKVKLSSLQKPRSESVRISITSTGFSFSFCVTAALFSQSPSFPSNLNIQPKRKGKGRKKHPSLSPPAPHSVARATVAILPCPVGLGYTSQAGHKCGMTVRDEEQREGSRRVGRKTDQRQRHSQTVSLRYMNK